MQYTHLTREHTDALLETAKMFHRENPDYANVPLNLGKTRAVVHALMDAPTACIIGAVQRNVVFGFIACEVTDDIWSDGKIASEHAFYVLPSSRKLGIGGELIKRFISFAGEYDAQVRLLINGGVDNEAAVDMLSKYGLERRGYVLGMER